MRRISIIFLILALAVSLATPILAKPYPSVPTILDEGGFFTAEEAAALEAACLAVEEGTGIQMMIATTRRTLWGEEILSRYGLAEFHDIVILVITYDYEYHYDLYTYGKAVSKLSNREVNNILDAPDVFDNLKGGALFEGSMAFTVHTEDALLTAALAPSNFPLSFFLICIGLAILLALIVCACVFFSYKKKKRSSSYPLEAYTKLDLTESRDIFLGSHVTKRYIPPSNSGGRSGGGRSGGSRGGGGGHRGGR